MVSPPQSSCVAVNYCAAPPHATTANTRTTTTTATIHASADQTTTARDHTSTVSAAAPTTQTVTLETSKVAANQTAKEKQQQSASVGPRTLTLRHSGYEPPSLVRMALRAIAEDPHRTLFNPRANLEGVGEKILTAIFLTVEMESKLTVPIVRTFVRIAQLENHALLLEYLKRFDVFAAIPLTPAKHLTL